ncbi:protein kinase domain-containing protein [Ditylenchus destructor]|nr:protein kinase domain-containing protein [Ditylenchus destructor]
MPTLISSSKPGSLKDPEVAELFSTKDPEARYDDLREIGHGSFGAVFFALDKETKETVAIKKMGFSGKQASEKWTDIVREVRFLKNIRHRHIVEYKACFLKEHTCWLVMEYCIGSASDIVEVHKKPIFECEIAAICEQALLGLQYLHSMKRIHRDVKAGNILLTDSGTVKLADLGSASLLCPAQSFVGTPYWMAPEVILAMDEGQYDERADIWSFGITCIELAERRPPLFNMNAMSALYHIAQNDPPCLSTAAWPSEVVSWSDSFYSFVDQCLRKDPQQRLSTNACLNHSFITERRSPNVISELIHRTKMVVRELDNFQYRKMRKLMYIEEQTSGTASEGYSVDIQEDLSIPDSQAVALMADFNHRKSELNSSMEVTTSDTHAKNRTIVSVGGEESGASSTYDADASTPPSRNQSISGLQSIDHNMQERINTIRQSKFSTLRTTKLISREVEEYKRENNMYEQMIGYKRLRQQYHKELKQLEERCKAEEDILRIRQEREYDALLQTSQKEQTKVKNQMQIELDKRVRENEEALRKYRKSKMAAQDHQQKCYVACQKKEYKFNKEKAKLELKERGLTRSQYDSALKTAKNDLMAAKAHAEKRFAEEQSAMVDAEIKELKYKQLLQLHTLENQLVNNELNIRARQIEVVHALLRKHHGVTKELEQNHFKEIELMKKRHMDSQHESEINNQKDYNKRALEDIRKQHALQSKQQPRELRSKEAQIRKQFRQAVKIQTRQFKAYQSQMLQTVPREEQKELLQRLKEEQNRKIAALADQYENTIEKMVVEQTVKLESWQEEDVKKLSEKLSKELSMLTDFQERQKAQLNTSIERERVQLLDRINLRLAILEQKMNEDNVRFEQERQRQLRQLTDRQSAQIGKFKAENGMQNGSDDDNNLIEANGTYSHARL